MSERPVTRILTRRQTAGRLLEHRPDLSVVRNQRRRARELAASLGNRSGAVAVLAAWLAANPDSDVRDLSTALDNRLQLRLVSVPPKERTPEVTEAALVEESFGLGWEQLDEETAAEILLYVSLTGGIPLPQELAAELAGVDAAGVDEVVEAGFAARDAAHCLTIDGATLTFLESRRELPQARLQRRLRLALGVRDHAGRSPTGRVELDSLAELACDLLGELRQPLPMVSLCHRLAERLRRRGDLSGAMRWVQRGRVAAQALGDDGLAFVGLLALDEACIVLADQSSVAARPHVQRAARLLAAASKAGHPGADAALLRAQLLRAQIEYATHPSAPEKELRGLSGKLGRERDIPARAAALQTLGTACFRRGDRSAGRALLHEARGLLEEVDEGGDSGLTAMLVAEAQGMHPAADPKTVDQLLERARVLAGGEMDRPPQSSLPLALHELGLAAGDKGDREAAATLLDEAAMLASSLLPRSHPVTATTAYSRGLLFLSDGEFRRAEKQLDRALSGWAGAYPKAHPIHAIGRAARAWAGARAGEIRHEDAARAVDEATAALGEAKGLDPGWTAQLHALRADLTAVPV
ncbi:MAG: tetratricopeptide repeat protein [Deltaproteobacteria bacterium]|nr:tetratricopeptide repeat protein [Deltaproteobacteria bacterium]